MHTIATLNKISPVGTCLLGSNYTLTDDVNDAEGILVRSADMHSMEFSDKLVAIARAGAGVNNIPVDRCADEGIVVFNTPGANANAVKELVLCALLVAARNVSPALAWTANLRETCGELGIAKATEKGKSQFVGHEIYGKTLGVIGLGAVGVQVANAAEELGMKVIGYDPYITVHAAHILSNSIPVTGNLDALLPQCDYLSIHVPAMDSTKVMINEDKIKLMKDGVVFLNFSRDELVNEKDMLEALDSGKVSKYVSDFPNDTTLGHPGVICMPHLGASTQEAEDNCAVMAVNQMMDYIENLNITNSVNFPNCSLGPRRTKARIGVMNRNIPKMISQITNIFAELDINISDMINRSKGDYAYTLIDVDSTFDEAEIRKALEFEGIISVRIVW
ncbi:MAG: phosphoglycerate dehydrogenase [Firmicutes bacterium]|nr:phosphoglycerate dehydrogenase [Bacillota bacterium]